MTQAKGGTAKRWLVWGTGAIAAVAVVVGNLDNILSTGAKWLGPSITSYLSPRASVLVALDDDVAVVADVIIADPSNETRAIAVGRTRRGQPAVLDVPANIFYTVSWQGAGLEAGAAPHVMALKGESPFRLVRMGQADGQVKVSLRPSNPNEPELPSAEPNAKLLLSARDVQSASAPSLSLANGALPELDRAVTIVGMFETGTTDCARRLFFIPQMSGADAAKVPAVGCVTASIPGWLAEAITALDGGDAHRLDLLIGEHASLLRNYVRDPHAIPAEPALRQAMERLIAVPEFWIRYQARLLAVYADAAEIAQRLGLVSERGRLLVFDQLIFAGPNSIARATRSYAERYPEGAPGRPDSEPARIRALGEILKADTVGRRSFLVARRIDTIVSGRGSIRGISFDLEQLGVSDAG